MRRLLFAAAAAALLASCAVAPAPQQLQAQGRGRVVIGAATLASVGTFEWTAAPTYTRLALLMQRAANRLDEKRITAPQAREILAQANATQSLLDQAKAAHPRDPDRSAELLVAARSALVDAEAFLEGASQ